MQGARRDARVDRAPKRDAAHALDRHRFRTKGIQDEAQAQAELLAERKGWTVADLADRTIPSAGFEDDGAIDLSYGPERRFSARLGELGNLEVYDGAGTKIKALPEPRQAEEFHGGQAKKALAAARKDVKTIVTLQSDRLYEALCTQRTCASRTGSVTSTAIPSCAACCRGSSGASCATARWRLRSGPSTTARSPT
jgi:hypothetical protein